MGNELIKRYREAEIQHKQKFGEAPVFIGIFMPGLDGEAYITKINRALKSGVPVNEHETAPKELLDNRINW